MVAYGRTMCNMVGIMIQNVTITRNVADGKYDDIVDVCEYLGDGVYGNATNALVQIVRKSPLFLDAVKKLNRAALDAGAQS